MCRPSGRSDNNTMHIRVNDRPIRIVLTQSCIGSRISWVRLEDPVRNMFFIVVYIPHKGRQTPSAEDTIAQVIKLMDTVQKSDCIVFCGDFNCQLQRHVKNYTGKWCMTMNPDNGHSECLTWWERRTSSRWTHCSCSNLSGNHGDQRKESVCVMSRIYKKIKSADRQN